MKRTTIVFNAHGQALPNFYSKRKTRRREEGEGGLGGQEKKEKRMTAILNDFKILERPILEKHHWLSVEWSSSMQSCFSFMVGVGYEELHECIFDVAFDIKYLRYNSCDVWTVECRSRQSSKSFKSGKDPGH